MEINNHVLSLISYGIQKKLVQKEDFDYLLNRMTELLDLNIEEYKYDYTTRLEHVSIILDHILDYSYSIKLFSPNTTNQRDLFESKIMDVFSGLPSDVNRIFNNLYIESPIKATDYYYKLSKDNNYIKTARISKNIDWESNTKYGKFEFTINLSKPEKDPLDIIASSKEVSSDYPKCVLCKENVGFYGNATRAGRSNHRIIKLDLNDELFYLQYSPYSYYNEHSIVLLENHLPMKVSIDTFKRLFDFVEMFPHYFLGSNAGLPIVGGSILSHEHYQGGKHNFPIEDAKIKNSYDLGEIKIQNLKWPISVIRLESENRDKIITTANNLFILWENYTNEDINIFSYTNEHHNAITPIARKKGEKYILDIALRNNLTSKDYPLGIYHTHKENQNIKKENIGLIEVMGLAVLPARLKEELKIIKDCLISNKELPKALLIHEDWMKELREIYFDQDINNFINEQVALKFISSLEDAAVFKDTDLGNKYFKEFMEDLVELVKNK